MSTPKSGWIARDPNGDLCWYDREPEWSENLREWLPEPYGDVSDVSADYPEIAPGECIQIGAEHAIKQARETGEAVHVEGATVFFPDTNSDNYSDKLERVQAQLAEAKSLLRQSAAQWDTGA